MCVCVLGERFIHRLVLNTQLSAVFAINGDYLFQLQLLYATCDGWNGFVGMRSCALGSLKMQHGLHKECTQIWKRKKQCKNGIQRNSCRAIFIYYKSLYIPLFSCCVSFQMETAEAIKVIRWALQHAPDTTQRKTIVLLRTYVDLNGGSAPNKLTWAVHTLAQDSRNLLVMQTNVTNNNGVSDVTRCNQV